MNVWYNNLIKPPFTPPQQYFPIAWGVLYFLMAVSFILILLSKKSGEKSIAICCFIIQLFFNLMWTFLFFGLKSIKLALLNVILIFIFLVLTIYYFFKISKPAGILLLPYLVQVIFAIYLTSGILGLNMY